MQPPKYPIANETVWPDNGPGAACVATYNWMCEESGVRSGTTKATIAVVEDEPGISEMIRDLLTMHGFAVLTAPHANQLLDLDPNNPPDLILVDLMLPDFSGTKLAESLRRRGFGHTPMIAMSAAPLLLHLARCSGLFQDAVAKPFNIADLIDCIERHAGVYVT
jgi:DNA-binding response OmpR family regulator